MQRFRAPAAFTRTNALGLAIGMMACGTTTDAEPLAAPQYSYDVAFEVIDSIDLQETQLVVNVAPVARIDPEGGFLLADRMEQQVRRYSEQGRILEFAGAKGGGPGQFMNLATAGRLESGQVLAAESSGGVALFTRDLDSVAYTLRLPLTRLEDLEVLDDTLVAFAAARPGREGLYGPRIHIFNTRTSKIQNSFFAPLPDAPSFDAAVMAGWTKISVHRGRLAAIFATSDTVYLFRLDGAPVAQLPLPSGTFRRVPEGPGPRGTADPQRAAVWLSTFDLMSDIAWVSDSVLVVLYQSVRPTAALERVWHLVAMSDQGRGLFEIRESPKFIAVDTPRDRLFFQAPGAMAPNKWYIARLRGEHSATHGPAVAAGDPLPSGWHMRMSGAPHLRAVWVLRTRDCMHCQSFDYELRRLQGRHGNTVPVTVVHVGANDGEDEELNAFLRQRRIKAMVVGVPEESLTGPWLNAATPELYLVDGDVVLWAASWRAFLGEELAASADSAATVLLSKSGRPAIGSGAQKQ
ncbi:MAG TPA: hypothetical protein VLH75_13100 [Longimicrobiales bacterium]|nr:hypothetical protein [Longimicrobiales bacterium]